MFTKLTNDNTENKADSVLRRKLSETKAAAKKKQPLTLSAVNVDQNKTLIF